MVGTKGRRLGLGKRRQYFPGGGGQGLLSIWQPGNSRISDQAGETDLKSHRPSVINEMRYNPSFPALFSRNKLPSRIYFRTI